MATPGDEHPGDGGLSQVDPFDLELKELLARHNKTLGDVAPESPTVEGIPEGVRRTVVEHIHTVARQQVSEGNRYRRLRTFSGIIPVPNGELAFDNWIQYADQLVQEPLLTEEVKRSRLVECLAPPALALHRKAVRELGSSAIASAILKQLTHAFGIACEADDLFSIFRETFQSIGETPSAYLLRLEEHLDRAVRFGGIDVSRADELRLSQFIRGSIYEDGLVGALQLRQHKSKPPGLVSLLQEVRIEEAAEAVRSSRRQQTKPNRKAAQLSHTSAEIDSYGKMEKEVGDLKSELASLKATFPSKVVPPAETGPYGKIEEDVGDLKAELASLKATFPSKVPPAVSPSSDSAKMLAELEKLRDELAQLRTSGPARTPRDRHLVGR